MADQPIIDGSYISAADSDDLDTAAEFQSFADEVRQSESADAWITVQRIPLDSQGNARPNSKGSSELFREPLGAATIADIIERCRRDFMRPGEYKMMIRVIGSQKGLRGVKFNKIMTIERANEPSTPGASPGNSTFENMMRAMQESQRLADERAERMITALTTRVSPANDPIDQMTKMMTAMGTMMGPMMAVMAGRPVTPTPDPTDSLVKLATTMKTLNGLFGSGNGGGGGGEDDSLMSIVKALVPVAKPALELMVEGKRGENFRAVRRQPPKALPANVTPLKPKPVAPANVTPLKPKPVAPAAPGASADPNASPIETPTEANNKGDDMDLSEMKKNLDVVCDLCEAGQSVEQVAKLVLSSIPEEHDEDFLKLLDDDSYVDNMALLNSRVTKNREWFEQLRAALLAEYVPDENPSAT